MRQPQLVPEGLMAGMHALLDGSTALAKEVLLCHRAQEVGKAWQGCNTRCFSVVLLHCVVHLEQPSSVALLLVIAYQKPCALRINREC